MSRRMALVIPWLCLAGVLACVALVVVSTTSEPETVEQRVQRLSAEVRCPECAGQSAAGSQANSARAVRDEIIQQVSEGRNDDEILGSLAASYGDDILLRPDTKGPQALLWVLPVVLFIGGSAAIVFTIRRRRIPSVIRPSDSDRELVESARPS